VTSSHNFIGDRSFRVTAALTGTVFLIMSL